MTHIEQPDMNDPGAPGAPGISAVVVYYLASLFVAVCSYSGFKSGFLFFNSYLTDHEASIIGPISGFFGAAWLFSVLALFGSSLKYASDEEVSGVLPVNRIIFFVACAFGVVTTIPVIAPVFFAIFDYVLALIAREQLQLAEMPFCDVLQAKETHPLAEIYKGFQCDSFRVMSWICASAVAFRLASYLGAWRVVMAFIRPENNPSSDHTHCMASTKDGMSSRSTDSKKEEQST